MNNKDGTQTMGFFLFPHHGIWPGKRRLHEYGGFKDVTICLRGEASLWQERDRFSP